MAVANKGSNKRQKKKYQLKSDDQIGRLNCTNVPHCEAHDFFWLLTLYQYLVFSEHFISQLSVWLPCSLEPIHAHSYIGDTIPRVNTVFRTRTLQLISCRGRESNYQRSNQWPTTATHWATVIPNKAAIWSGIQNKPLSGPWVENALSTTVSMDELTLSYNWAIQTGTWAHCTSNFS